MEVSGYHSPGETAVRAPTLAASSQACISAPETLYKWKTQNTASHNDPTSMHSGTHTVG